jgi:hypothetical protein
MKVALQLPRNAQLWLPGYWKSAFARRAKARHVWVMIGDHYEPGWQGATPETARDRVAVWRKEWPAIAARHVDSDGRPPQYTFFYPEEEYGPELLEPLAEMTRSGIGDVEIHLHHDGESEAGFLERMEGFKETLAGRHALLRQVDGRLVFGFIHGNWALDNSRPDGRWCGLNNEITLLKQIGCYADFTLPSVPSPAQTRTVNSIYWAKDDPSRPKSHDTGVPLRPGGGRDGDLLMVQGPLAVRFERGRPRIDTGELAVWDPPTEARVRAWFRVAPQIGEHMFIKLFAHGAQERHAAVLLRGGLDRLFRALIAHAAAEGCRLHFVTAWQMYNAIEALRAGADPGNGVPLD